MAGLEIIPFSEEHLDAAAVLLEARHARHREAEPLLPAEVDFRAQLESEWHTDGASGVFAIRAGKPVGYLVAAPRHLGPVTWMTVGIGGLAVEGDRELAQDLYAVAAEAWVEAGHMSHAVFIPAADAALRHRHREPAVRDVVGGAEKPLAHDVAHEGERPALLLDVDGR